MFYRYYFLTANSYLYSPIVSQPRLSLIVYQCKSTSFVIYYDRASIIPFLFIYCCHIHRSIAVIACRTDLLRDKVQNRIDYRLYYLLTSKT